MTTPTTAPSGPHPGLHAEMRAVESAHRTWHWHLFLSSEGKVWAVCPHNTYGGSGTTLGPGTCEGLNRAIAVVEREWAA